MNAREMVNKLTDLTIDLIRIGVYNEESHKLVLEIRELKKEIVKRMEKKMTTYFFLIWLGLVGIYILRGDTK